MHEQDSRNRPQEERAPGLALFKEALRNIITSSPEVMNGFADQLEEELSTLDTDEGKKAVQKAVEAIRAASLIVEQN
ncbi:MAG: hypothetical protein AAB375_03470 [Patescibacteria group bacterium]